MIGRFGLALGNAVSPINTPTLGNEPLQLPISPRPTTGLHIQLSTITHALVAIIAPIGLIAMRLLHAGSIQPVSFEEDIIPDYAILSHTWGDDEVSFQDIHSPGAASKAGYAKIRYACQEALRRGLKYVWVDTCCIDKTSSAELSEAINSMFRWYKYARVCFGYLSDVPVGEVDSPKSAFASSRWFSRGWTLQELLAPIELEFFSSDWEKLGSKRDLSRQISDITGIGEGFIAGAYPLSDASIAKKMSWASCRETTRNEDLAYCLLGIFEINMPLLYGEGEKAFLRPQEEIMKTSDDQTLFAWEYEIIRSRRIPRRTYSPFARSPAFFRRSGQFVPDELNETSKPYVITNKGLQINLSIIKLSRYEFHLAALVCRTENQFHSVVAIPISFRSPDSIIRLEYRNVCLIRRDEVTCAPIRSVHFPIGISVNPFPFLSTDHPSLVIRNLPRNKSLWTILKVEPDDIWDPEQRVIRLSEDEKRQVVISRDPYTLDEPYEPYMSYMVFQESHSQNLSYETVAFSNSPNRISSVVRVTIGKENIRMSTGIVIRTLDIEVISDIELEIGQVD
jgi:PHD/YefM family antitoxin component YafN of YafNO toxin-antitoxin module